jgi:hypothetical protein
MDIFVPFPLTEITPQQRNPNIFTNENHAPPPSVQRSSTTSCWLQMLTFEGFHVKQGLLVSVGNMTNSDEAVEPVL